MQILEDLNILPEAEEGGGIGRVGEHVEESQDEEGKDVLNVILVSPPHSLNILTQALSGLAEQNFVLEIPESVVQMLC